MIAIITEIMIIFNIVIFISAIIRLEIIVGHRYHYYKYNIYIVDIQCVLFLMILVI